MGICPVIQDQIFLRALKETVTHAVSYAAIAIFHAVREATFITPWYEVITMDFFSSLFSSQIEQSLLT